MTNQQPSDPATDETSQAERIRRLEHRCDMEAAHLFELKAQVRKLIAERDEARRWFCERAEWLDGGDGTQTANEHGWDCFREDGK